MMRNIMKNLAINSIPGTLSLLLFPLLFPTNDFARGGGILLMGVVLYFVMVLCVADKNWMDARALFSAVWLCSIGLAQLRLLSYQKVWEQETWVCVALAYAWMQTGLELGLHWAPGLSSKVTGCIRQVKWCTLHEERYYYICVVTSIIGLLCFCYSISYSGFIPLFASDPSAYALFHSRLHLFSIAATMVSGLCYYCIKCQKLSRGKKAILWICIAYHVFVFPIMIVSRGNFIMIALTFSTVVFYLNRKKLWVFICCLAVMLGVYEGTSLVRSYTDEYLLYVFEPKNFVAEEEVTTAYTTPTEAEPVDTTPTEAEPVDTTPTEAEPVDTTPTEAEPVDTTSTEAESVNTTPTETEPMDTTPTEAEPVDTVPQSFQLSPSVAFLYSYLTSSHDNFNEAVQYAQTLSYGVRQFLPFNMIFRIDSVDEAAQSLENYQVKPELNMSNLISDAYYDFRVPGVAVLTALWGIFFGLIQGFYEERKSIFALLWLGNAMIPVVLSFFSSWMGGFVLWVRWGTVLLFLVAACIPSPNFIKKRK